MASARTKASGKKPAGRPSSFTQEVADEICERLVDGDSLRAICSEKGMPDKATVLRWALDRQDFRDQYARARELAAETDADDISHYSRQAARGEIEPAAATAAINGLKWSAGKRAPKKFGEAIQLKHADADGGKLVVNVKRFTPEPDGD